MIGPVVNHVDADHAHAARTCYVREAPTAAEDNAVLLRRYRAGDRGAGDALVRSLMPFLLGVAKSYAIGFDLDLDDVMQEALIAFLKAAEAFDGTTRELEPFAMVVIRNHLIDVAPSMASPVQMTRHALRTEGDGAQPTTIDLDDDEAILEGLVDSSPTPEETLDEANTARRFFVALEQISPPYARVVRRRLLDNDDPTLAEVGREMGISRERTRQIQVRARARPDSSVHPPRLGAADAHHTHGFQLST